MPFRQRRGFTLVELLVVLGIISLLVAAAVPAFNALARSQTVGKSAHELAALLELARTEAITRQTYVWVGLQAESQTGRNGIIAAAVYSKDGTGGNVTVANLVPLTRAISIPFTRLVLRSELKSAMQELFGRPSVGLLENREGISFTAGNRQFTQCTLTFTPDGEALLKGAAGPDDGFDECIDVNFRLAKGQTTVPNAEEVSLTVNGANGTVKILRIQ
jgi:prepilin-type N-terminal cleavage/methylation domain-containing protein